MTQPFNDYEPGADSEELKEYKPKSVSGQSCFTCKYKNFGGNYFPVGCNWFPEHGKGTAKDIPTIIAGIGCKLYEKGDK